MEFLRWPGMRRGFTLLEMMIVLAIVAVIGAALFMTMSTGRTSWYEADTQIALQEELRKAMRQITEDLVQSSKNQVSIPADGVVYSSMTLNISQGVFSNGTINWGTPVSYALIGGQINRSQGSDSRILANNITQMDFKRQVLSSNIVRINLTARKSTQWNRLLNASLESGVSLRN